MPQKVMKMMRILPLRSLTHLSATKPLLLSYSETTIKLTAMLPCSHRDCELSQWFLITFNLWFIL